MSMTYDEMIAVIQAHKDGKIIQIKSSYYGCDEWRDRNASHSYFNFLSHIYRVKPEPKVMHIVANSDGSIVHISLDADQANDTLKKYSNGYGAYPPYSLKKFVEVLEE